MNEYELTVLAKDGLDLEAFLKKLKVKILKTAKSEERLLAYEINKQKKGVYSYCEIEADPSVISDLEAKLKLDDKVLRSLIIIKEK
ncbi:30S ribosomal protein S6 [Candidatus Gottesmanbacteria bacterium RIFCSPHIGHO2_01_FULL_42_12]|uniref:Small ribosomal subunit protein bS6 n=1 Tax=Candidatus Gottesmanbacteria bacterium RIFCSPHIGHO2_01_FULL_42_12 TaxID=1798377 RepID=A0A1F5YZT4_9BACT|nr:MAG: 30S ribosomal protein S6 [Candidatus Gottesmanbacteria bacterium RIFCSPHIGHO2_01_FULL_42_12]